MQLMSYDEALSELCDNFDALISPKKLKRANTNVIYLLLKAFAKGWEVINSTVYALYGKFIPTLCSDEDLVSLGYITGTRKIGGSYSGLYVTAVNNSPMPVKLLKGTYSFSPDDNITFSTVIEDDVEIQGESSTGILMMSDKVGSFHYTGMSDVKLTSDADINDSVTFSCSDNATLLGHDDESNLSYRKRILEDTSRQDIISELRDSIKSLPYVFDCNIKFNNTAVPVIYDGYTIDPYRMLLMISGDLRDDIAQVVASKGIYPTQKTDGAKEIVYKNDVFFNGFSVFVTPFREADFSLTITYAVDDVYLTVTQAEVSMRNALFVAYAGNTHFDVLTENDVFNVLTSIDIAGLKVLGVSLSYDGKDKLEYIKFDVTRIPKLVNVSFQVVTL